MGSNSLEVMHKSSKKRRSPRNERFLFLKQYIYFYLSQLTTFHLTAFARNLSYSLCALNVDGEHRGDENVRDPFTSHAKVSTAWQKKEQLFSFEHNVTMTEQNSEEEAALSDNSESHLQHFFFN